MNFRAVFSEEQVFFLLLTEETKLKVFKNLTEFRAGNHLWPYKMFRMKEEKEAKQAKEEKELKKEREK